MRISNVVRITTVIACMFLGACRSASSPSGASLSEKPADYIVVYVTDDGKAHPDPAVLLVDATKNQEIFFIAQGTDLVISFNDPDQFKIRCGAKRCTAKLNPDKQHQVLVDYKYKITWTDRQEVRRTVDPVVIIDEIAMTLTAQ